MGYLVVLYTFLFLNCVLSDEGLTKPCSSTDLECLNISTEQFLEKTSAGIPDFNIRPIDPMAISALDTNEMPGVKIRFENVNITGMKKQQISEFKLDTTANSVILSNKLDLNMNGNVQFKIIKASKTFSGTFIAKLKPQVTVTYNYELKADDKGVEHFYIGPETISCQIPEEFTGKLDSELQKTLRTDSDSKAKAKEHEAQMYEIQKKTLCKVVEMAYVTIIHNIRESAKLLSKHDFLTDV